MPAPTRSGRRAALLVGAAVAMVVVAEGLTRFLAPGLPVPMRFADATTEVKARQLTVRSTTCTDIVLVGDSMARDDLVPSTFTASDPDGRTAYNAALDAATPRLLRSWLTDRVLPATRPATVVVAVAPHGLSVGNRAGAAAEEAASAAPETRPDVLGALDRAVAPRLALLEHRNELRDPALLAHAVAARWRGDDAPPPTTSGVVDADGAGRSRRALRFTTDRVHDDLVRRQLLGDLTVDPAQLDALRSLVTDVRATGAEPVLAVLPVTDHFRSLHGPHGWDRGVAAITSLAAETGTPVLRLDEVEPPEEQFADSHHLNGAGADALSARLPGALAAAGVAADRC